MVVEREESTEQVVRRSRKNVGTTTKYQQDFRETFPSSGTADSSACLVIVVVITSGIFFLLVLEHHGAGTRNYEE